MRPPANVVENRHSEKQVYLFGSDNLPKVGSIVAKLLFGTYELENKES